MSLGVAIVAGGEGRRLAAVAGGRTKALAPFAGETLLDHQLAKAESLRPERVVVLAHHQAAAVAAHVGERAEVLVEPRPLGTAGGLHLLPPEPDRWLILNVDHVSDIDLAAFVAGFHYPCTAAVARVPLPVDEGVVELAEGRIVAWRERPVLRIPVTTGLYVFSRAALAAALTGAPCDMPALVQRLLPVTAWVHEGTWFDAGTPERLAAAETWLRS